VGEGFERYYTLRGESGAPAAPVRSTSYLWLEKRLAEAPDAGSSVRRLTLDVQGVHCAACVWLLQSLYRRREGAVDIRINPALGKAELIWMPSRLDLLGYLEEAGRFGYGFGPDRKRRSRTGRALAVRLGIAIAAAMNAMIFAWCFHLGLDPGDGLVYTVFGVLTALMTTIAVGASGWVFFRSAFHALRARIVHLDVPIALGLALAYAGSFWTYLAHGPEATYFDTVAIFAALMLVGRWLQSRILERNRQLMLADDGVDSLHVRRLHEGRLEAVSASELRAGDTILVVAGDLVPVRSRAAGPALVSLDWITGESAPISLEEGSVVPAGAFNAGHTSLRLEVVEPFEGSYLRELLELGPRIDTEHAERDARAGAARMGSQGFWARVSTIYVLSVLALAALALLIWLRVDPSRALSITVATLVVTCPCALGLATPLGRELIYTALKRRGVFLRSETFLDRALSLEKLLFDKTGTMTIGTLEPTGDTVQGIASLAEVDRIALLTMAAQSNHPVSVSITRHVRGVGAPHLLDAPVREEAGAGTELFSKGHVYRLGRRSFALASKQRSTGEPELAESAVFSRDGQPLLGLSFCEVFRSDAAEECRKLAALGFELHLLSGDKGARTLEAADHLGIPHLHARGDLSPREKADFVRALDRRDTLMVGDGINDSPSFGEAYCTATPAVDRATLPARADFYYLGEGVGAVRRAIIAAKHLRRVTAANLVFTTVYNVGVLGFCLAGHVTPLAAAVVMPVSSVIVVSFTAWRIRAREAKWMS